jgi:hypothetical protein
VGGVLKHVRRKFSDLNMYEPKKVAVRRRRTRPRDMMKPEFNSIFIAHDIGYIVNHWGEKDESEGLLSSLRSG